RGTADRRGDPAVAERYGRASTRRCGACAHGRARVPGDGERLVTALRVPNFRRMWFAGLVSDTGDWVLLAALPILVYQLTASTLGTAAAFLVELVPPVLLAPVAGRIADQFDRRRTLVVVSLLQAVALVPLLLVRDRSDLAIVYAVIAVESALAAVFDPTKNALLPTLVDAERLVSANSLVGLNQNIGRLVGAPLGGLLLAIGGHAFDSRGN